MKKQEAIEHLKSEWDKVITEIIENPMMVERNQRLVQQYENLQKRFEEQGFDTAEAKSYQFVGDSSEI